MNDLLTISICTNDREELLLECLEALEASSRKVNILVINNSPNEFKEVQIKYPHVLVVKEPKIGLSNARNCAINNCTSEYLGFIDDDALVEKNLVEKVVDFIKDFPNITAFGGRYIPWYKQAKPSWFKDQWGSSIVLQDKRGRLNEGYFPGGISFWKVDRLKAINGFNPELGMKGDLVSYGEEVLAQKKLRDQGDTLGYDASIVMKHLVPGYKFELNWHAKSNFALGRDSWRFVQENHSQLKRLKVQIKARIVILKASLMMAFNPKSSTSYVEALRTKAFAQGRLSGLRN